MFRVWGCRGGTLNQIAKHCTTLVGFDSFSGLPEEWNIGSQVVPSGTFAGQPPRPPENASLEVGLFQDTLGPFLAKHPDTRFDMVHLDMDIYSAAHYVLDTLIKNDRLIDTVLVFDELINYPRFHEGELKALKEMVDKYQLRYEIIGSHGDLLTIRDFETMKLSGLGFHELRQMGYYQECAIRVLGYTLPGNRN